MTFIPSNTIRVKAKDKPWCNTKLKQLIRKRNRAFKRYQRTKRPEHFDIYCSLRNTTLAENRRLKFRYDSNLQNSLSNNTSSVNFWHVAKNLMEDKSSFSIPTLVGNDGTLSSEPLLKANSFNEFFAKQCCPADDLTHEVPGGLPQYTRDSLCDVEFDLIKIYEDLLALNVTKATGPDLIGNRILKSCAAPLAKPLQILFQCSMASALYPSAWKDSHVIPVHKKRQSSIREKL